jgi:exonuclease III
LVPAAAGPRLGGFLAGRRHPQEREYSWFSASRGNGFRYDHALASPPLDARIRSVRYAQELRAAGLSDHAGLVVELG